MIDKLSLTSPEVITFEEAANCLKSYFSYTSRSASRYHQSVVTFKKGNDLRNDHLLTLHTEPRFYSSYPVKIEINPSRFSSFESLKQIIGLIAPIQDCRITRIDHALDLKHCSVSDVERALIYSRKKSREVFRESLKLTGFYLGKPPEQLVVYDRGKKLKLDSNVTRIELRHYREKIEHQAFTELPNYLNSNPFAKLKFQKLKSSEPKSIYEKRKLDLLREYLAATGAQATYKLLNRTSNFKRDYSSVLEVDETFSNLDHMYREELKPFFGWGMAS